MPCYSPLKGYKDPETGGLVFKRDDTKETMDVACGQCIGCRLDRSRMWAARITHEATLHELNHGNSFVTLTYRPEIQANEEQKRNGWYLPDDWSLNKEHFQKFMKRLRKAYPQKIKYYHCGEYGSTCRHGINLDLVECPVCKLGRPHYHACLFNISFDDLEPYAVQKGTTRYTSPKLEKIWRYGFVDVGKVEFQSAAYVARYIMKKVNGQMQEEHYRYVDPEDGTISDLLPEYSTMSNGIGLDWYNKYSEDIWPSDEMPVPGHGIYKKVPRYYQDKLEEEDPQTLEMIKQKRLRYRRENESEYTPERLYSKYKIKKAQTSTLKREI